MMLKRKWLIFMKKYEKKEVVKGRGKNKEINRKYKPQEIIRIYWTY
jgi:hypothetical protein